MKEEISYLNEHEIVRRRLDGMSLLYSTREGVTSFVCVPEGCEKEVKPRKLFREFNEDFPHVRTEPMVQVALTGDSLQRDFSAGVTLCNASTAMGLRAYRQLQTFDGNRREVVTFLRHPCTGFEARHRVGQVAGYSAAEASVELYNGSDQAVTVELSASLALNGLSPFCEENIPQSLILHRLQSNWSGEGRRESLPVSHYNLEDSWSSLGVRDQRIGQLGSMPARGYFPFAAIEDTRAGVIWAVQLEAPGSWQIETFDKNGALTLCGGLADYLYGHWRKRLEPGERFVTPTAYFTAVKGGLTEACARLTEYQDTLLRLPESEESLPVLYNEYLYTWGKPDVARLRPQMRRARELGAEYFVVDAGWFCERGDCALGDWNVNPERLPRGLAGLKEELEACGYALGGVWFEFEGVTAGSVLLETSDCLLKLDGRVIERGGRMLLDFRNPKVRDFLSEKVIGSLLDSGLRYIKIDYNENVGFGVDGAESPGEGLRRHLEQVVGFYRKLRDSVPGLVMEICSSGGMRHEPVFLTLGSMVSFSDAHEGPEGAVIAADLHRVMQPRLMQIWACVQPGISESDAYFIMAKAMLGRICLSGDLAGLSPRLAEIVREGVDFYSQLKEVIKSGNTTLIDTDEIDSLRHLRGKVRLVRVSRDGRRMACYAFAFHQPARRLCFDTAGYRLIACYGDGRAEPVENGSCVVTGGGRWSGTVLLLERDPKP